MSDRDELISAASRLLELDRLIVRAFVDWAPNRLAEYLTEFAEAKATIRSALAAQPIVSLPDQEASPTRTVIRKVASGEPLPLEKALSGSSVGNVPHEEMSEAELDGLGRDELYSWFSHYEYAEGLVEAGALVIASGTIPSTLTRFVDEARQCFAFQQYNAVSSLCRTVFEIGVKDVATTYGVLTADVGNIRKLGNRWPDLKCVIDRLAGTHEEFRNLKERLHSVRRKTNPIAHGGRLVGKEEAKATMQEALACIAALYDVHERVAPKVPRPSGA